MPNDPIKDYKFKTEETEIIARWIVGNRDSVLEMVRNPRLVWSFILKLNYAEKLESAEIFGVWRSLALHALERVDWKDLAEYLWLVVNDVVQKGKEFWRKRRYKCMTFDADTLEFWYSSESVNNATKRLRSNEYVYVYDTEEKSWYHYYKRWEFGWLELHGFVVEDAETLEKLNALIPCDLEDLIEHERVKNLDSEFGWKVS